jgi:hypothetical protein
LVRVRAIRVARITLAVRFVKVALVWSAAGRVRVKVISV